MRKTASRSAMAAAILCAVIMSSCQKYSGLEGQPIRFSVSSGTETKASYSGVTSSGKERIDWESGDLIRVYCAKSPEQQTADYVVNSSGITADGAKSKATASVSGGTGLTWGEGEHVFYAVYPSPASTGKSADVLSEGSVKGNIPSSQKPLSLTSSGDAYTAKADLLNQYMVSRTTKTPSGDDDVEVTLPFTPITTAIEFTIENGFTSDDALKIRTVTLTSATKNLSGTFTANISTTGWTGAYPTCAETGGDGTKSVSMDFSSTDMKTTGLAKGKTLTFTVFLAPTTDVNDLTFKLTKADGSWVSTKLAYSNDATHGNAGLTFSRCKKHYVHGLLIPEGAVWTVKYAPTVEKWNNGGNTPINPVPQVNYDTFVTSWDRGVEENLELTKPDYLPGLFSVSSTKQVRFSKGNLVTTVDASGAPSAWRFHENQYDSLLEGGANVTIGISEGDVDLFVWSTFENCLYGICTEPSNIYGTFADWGLTIDNDGTWRTLSMYEWDYLFKSRLNAASKFGCATVAEKHGIIIIPDGIFTDPMKNGGSNEFVPGPLPDYEQNIYSAGEDWATMESAGAVFLPVTGDGSIFNDGSMSVISCDEGNYWGSTLTGPSGSSDTLRFCYMSYNKSYTYTTSVFRGTGCRNAVRLVTDVN